MRVDVTLLNNKTLEDRDVVIRDWLTAAEAESDPLFISDLMIDDRGEMVLQELREDPNPKYILQVLRDEWGQPVQPGDIVRRKFKKPLTRHGKLIPVKQLKQWKRSGRYEQERYTFRDYVVDEKGCIIVTAEDAEWFMKCFGVHSVSGAPISYHYQETSESPVKRPDGSMKTVWYWRYQELERAQYDALPTLKKDNRK